MSPFFVLRDLRAHFPRCSLSDRDIFTCCLISCGATLTLCPDLLITHSFFLPNIFVAFCLVVAGTRRAHPLSTMRLARSPRSKVFSFLAVCNYSLSRTSATWSLDLPPPHSPAGLSPRASKCPSSCDISEVTTERDPLASGFSLPRELPRRSPRFRGGGVLFTQCFSSLRLCVVFFFFLKCGATCTVELHWSGYIFPRFPSSSLISFFIL